MYRIVTASFRELNAVEAAGYFPIAISTSQPKGIKPLPNYRPLNPLWEMVAEYKRTKNTEVYIECYNKILNKLSPITIISDLYRISGNRPVAMLCWEKAGDFCHRRLAASFLEKHIDGLIVPEFSLHFKE